MHFRKLVQAEKNDIAINSSDMAQFSSKYTRLSAFAQILLGALCIIFGIADRVKIFKFYNKYDGGSYQHSFHTQSVVPIWTGAWIFVTGVIGIAGSRCDPNTNKPSGMLIGTYLGFSIASIFFAWVVIIMYGIGIALILEGKTCSEKIVFLQRRQYQYDQSQTSTIFPIYITINQESECKTSVGLGAMIIIFAALEFGVGIWACICCCLGICRCCQPSGQSQPKMGELFLVQTQHGPASYVMTKDANGVSISVPATSSVAMTTGQAGQTPMQAPSQQVAYSSPMWAGADAGVKQRA